MNSFIERRVVVCQQDIFIKNCVYKKFATRRLITCQQTHNRWLYYIATCFYIHGLVTFINYFVSSFKRLMSPLNLIFETTKKDLTLKAIFCDVSVILYTFILNLFN